MERRTESIGRANRRLGIFDGLAERRFHRLQKNGVIEQMKMEDLRFFSACQASQRHGTRKSRAHMQEWTQDLSKKGRK